MSEPAPRSRAEAMNGNRNQTATGATPHTLAVYLRYLQLTATLRLAPHVDQCLQRESNPQPSGNECLSGAVEPGLGGHKPPGNPAAVAEHRAKGRAKIATERQSWEAR